MAFFHIVATILLAHKIFTSSSFTVPTVSPTKTRGKSRICAQEKPDLFDYFDPLLSPHAYPNGISPDAKPVDPTPDTFDRPAPPLEEEINPLRLKRLGTINESIQTPPSVNGDRPLVDTTSTFDPTLSPHAYVNGTPDVVVGDENSVYIDDASSLGGVSAAATKVLGIILIDHGSKNEASNRRLHTMAQLYQESLEESSPSSSTRFVVRAAHMEIAEPSIPVVLAGLVEEGLDEIVCHPYFLSPAGRHASEDIPRIIEQAIESMQVDIPIVTTPPVGADLQLMLGAVHSLVEQSSTLLKTK